MIMPIPRIRSLERWEFYTGSYIEAVDVLALELFSRRKVAALFDLGFRVSRPCFAASVGYSAIQHCSAPTTKFLPVMPP